MTKPRGDRRRMHAGNGERGRVRMAQIVEADRREVEPGAQDPPGAPQIARDDRPPRLVHEHESASRDAPALGGPHARAMRLERIGDDAREVDAAAAPRGLRRLDRAAMLVELAADDNCVVGDVGPAQSERFGLVLSDTNNRIYAIINHESHRYDDYHDGRGAPRTAAHRSGEFFRTTLGGPCGDCNRG